MSSKQEWYVDTSHIQIYNTQMASVSGCPHLARCQQKGAQPNSVIIPPPHKPKEVFHSQEQAEGQQALALPADAVFSKRVDIQIFHNFQRSYSIVFCRGQTCPVYVIRAVKWCLYATVFPLACNFHTKSFMMPEIKETKEPASLLRAPTDSQSFWVRQGDRNTSFLISYSCAFLMGFLEVTQLKSVSSFLVYLSNKS